MLFVVPRRKRVSFVVLALVLVSLSASIMALVSELLKVKDVRTQFFFIISATFVLMKAKHENQGFFLKTLAKLDKVLPKKKGFKTF